MRYHYKKPDIYLSMYGKLYICNHPVYDRCTLFTIGDKGLAVIQQRFNPDTKTTFVQLLRVQEDHSINFLQMAQ